MALPGEEERRMLRNSVQGYLEQYWPVEAAVENAESAEAIHRIWRGLAELGLAGLGSNPEEGGLREVLIVFELLGRTACPAPMSGAAMLNLLAGSQRPAALALQDLLTDLASGDAAVAFSLGNYDGDANAGKVELRDGKLTGRARFVEGAEFCSHVAVVADGPILCIVRIGQPGVQVVPQLGLGRPALAEVVLESVCARHLPLELRQVEDLHRVARLLLVARSFGAARRAFELAVEYAKERHQFGQPIGRFQAIQHKLANCLISLEGVSHALAQASSCFDHADPDWCIFTALCHAFASPNLRQVVLEAHHTFAAIGYAEEHELPRHFRRIHCDQTRLGGARLSRNEIAGYLLDSARTLPAYDLGEAGNAFRREVREWLETHWIRDGGPTDRVVPFHERGYIKSYPEFASALADTGWIAASWPREFGGQERTPLEQLAMTEEFQRLGVPVIQVGEIQAFALMKYGTEEQRNEYLPKLRQGQIRFCLGYSEPGAGSDLAAMKTTAVKDGDDWVINGQKLWTTGAEKSDYMWLAARTDPDARPVHAGISVFIVPMDTPGISVRPSMALYGHTFCTEFLDNVRVPASALVGEVNGGWKILTSALATERILMGGAVAQALATFNSLLDYVRSATTNSGAPLAEDGAVRDKLAFLAAEIEVARQLLAHSVGMVEQGKVPTYEAAMSKVYTGELLQRVSENALDIAGMGVTLGEGVPGAITDGRMEQMLRRSIMMVVGGGTAEIQRSLIAQRGLELPR
ncbi:acyl-CoA dehydrogenase [Paraburkholderia phytofirmans]|uniref:acyl-CoA dehydrogenase n=1 Tax=Paraburkholderia phytofirmans TaxID=261302 RepID=UPI0038B9B739